jgi:hypothetical protein
VAARAADRGEISRLIINHAAKLAYAAGMLMAARDEDFAPAEPEQPDERKGWVQ